jgi:hypothetical protein
VCCVDMERRACFAHYQEAFLAEGKPAPGHIDALDNLRFEERDVASPEIALGKHSAVVCVHACNEANLLVLRRCRDASATWAVVPCCLPEGLHGTDCRHLPDALRCEKRLFLSNRYVRKNDRFTKTGSGQNMGKVEQRERERGAFFAGTPRW